MKLQKILKIHRQSKIRNCLVRNLGDGFLLRANPIYRRIREETVRAKFKFTSNRFQNYDVFTLAELPQILSKRTIPYLDNVAPLQEIERKAPGIFSLGSIPPLRGNRIFHESAHAVAHLKIEEIVPSSRKSGVSKERDLALRILFEESFANACESLANIYSDSEVHDEFLYKNSYVMENKSFKTLLRKSVSTFGISPVFRLMLLSFLHANFLKIDDIENSLIRSIRIAFHKEPTRLHALTDSEIKLLTRVFKSGLDLDPDFTQFTNRFCLRLVGIRTDLDRLFQFDFLSSFESNPSYVNAFEELSLLIASA